MAGQLTKDHPFTNDPHPGTAPLQASPFSPVEADYRQIFENASVGIYRSSLDGRQVRANPALVKLNGYADETELLAEVSDIVTEWRVNEWYVDPTRRQTFKRLLLSEGRVANFESEIYRHKTRERIWISENAWLIRDERGTPLYFEGTVEEVTGRKRQEAQLSRLATFRSALMQFVEDSLRRGLDESFYQRLLGRAAQVIPGVEAGSILVKDDAGTYHFVAAFGYDLAALQQVTFKEHELLLADERDETLITDDVAGHSEQHFDAERLRVLEEAGRLHEIKSFLSLPVKLGGEIVAALNLDAFSEDVFTSETKEMADAFTQQVAALLKQLTLQDTLQTRQRDLERWAAFRSGLMSFVRETLQRGLDESFYQRLLEHAVKVIPGAEAGSILLRGDDTTYAFVAALGYDLAALQTITLEERELVANMSGNEAQSASDLASHDRKIMSEKKRRVLETAGRIGEIGAFVSLPVEIEGERVAVLNLNTFHRGTFDRDACEMANAFAAQVASLLQRLTLERKLERSNRELAQLANYDALTGLPNRALFTERLAQTLTRAERAGRGAGLLFLDLDGFKTVNDSLGHTVGDTLLRAVAKRLKNCVREADTVARLGGDEFTLVLERLDDAQDAACVARKVLECLSHPFRLGEREVYIGASIGITTYPEDGGNAEVLVKHADTAMYHAKAQGKNRYHFFTHELNRRVLEGAKLESDMRGGLQRGEFCLHYQPRVDLATGRITSVEALARWQHPERGLVSPYHFIPAAERSGLIGPLGREMLRQACLQAKAWVKQGTPLRVAVNLSVKQLQQPTITDEVRAVLDEVGLNAKWLELEVTESAAMLDVDTTTRRLGELKEMGIYLSVDDFGTGYSSLTYLKHLPVSSLKIDKSFVQDISDETMPNSADAAIVRAVIALGQSLNFTLIAEGVETEAQRTFLEALGCHEAQGYLFSKPVPAEGMWIGLEPAC